MFDAVLIANRGEIAIRVARACRELGVRSVAVYSEVDADAPHVRAADEAILLGAAPPAESYLHVERILAAAQQAGVDAIHPGYGFLSENADFAQAVADAGLAFVGPPAAAIASMGNKLSARAVADSAGVAVVPGTNTPAQDVDAALAFGTAHGYPVAVKAAFGGGGRGMKVVTAPDQMGTALAAAQREAVGAFGRGECYLERYLTRPRHVELQILADTDGTTIHLGDRDCSLQRRHQKLVEEAPAPALDADVREAMAEAAVRVAKQMGYVNAGTCEFLLDADGQTFYFLEMNTRLQVEHPVTEMVTGIDLVHAQLRIAAGDGMGLTQDDVDLYGHAIEVRLNAEDPSSGFMPGPGRISRMVHPDGPGVRLDTGAESGYEIPQAYDSLIGKLVVWGPDRDTARMRMSRALTELVIDGVATTAPFHTLAMDHPQFAAAEHSTVSVEHEWDLSGLPQPTEGDGPPTTETSAPTVPAREVELTIAGRSHWVTVYGAAEAPTARTDTRRQRRGDRAADTGARADGPELRAPMQGVVVSYQAESGQTVEVGDLIVVLEAMKMETHVTAHRAGVVTEVPHAVGDVVERGVVLAIIGPE